MSQDVFQITLASLDSSGQFSEGIRGLHLDTEGRKAFAQGFRIHEKIGIVRRGRRRRSPGVSLGGREEDSLQECNEVNDLTVHNGKLYAGVIPKAERYLNDEPVTACPPWS